MVAPSLYLRSEFSILCLFEGRAQIVSPPLSFPTQECSVASPAARLDLQLHSPHECYLPVPRSFVDQRKRAQAIQHR